MAGHVSYNSWYMYISFPSSAQQQRRIAWGEFANIRNHKKPTVSS